MICLLNRKVHSSTGARATVQGYSIYSTSTPFAVVSFILAIGTVVLCCAVLWCQANTNCHNSFPLDLSVPRTQPFHSTVLVHFQFAAQLLDTDWISIQHLYCWLDQLDTGDCCMCITLTVLRLWRWCFLTLFQVHTSVYVKQGLPCLYMPAHMSCWLAGWLACKYMQG